MVWEMTPWKPFEFEKIRREVDHLWDSFFEGRTGRRGGEAGQWLPSLDLSETKNEFVVKAELPGIDRKSVV